MLSYTFASTGSGHRTASYMRFALFAFAFVTIRDLDRPRSSAIRVTQQALVDAFTALPLNASAIAWRGSSGEPIRNPLDRRLRAAPTDREVVSSLDRDVTHRR